MRATSTFEPTSEQVKAAQEGYSDQPALGYGLRQDRRAHGQPEQPRVRAEQVGQDSLEPRSGRFRRGFGVHTHWAETIPSQIQDESSPGDGDEAEQRTELRQLGRHDQRHGDDRRVGDQRGQGDLAALAGAMPQRLGQQQRQQGAGGKAAGEAKKSPGCQSRYHYGPC